jgi:hypothetical protein
MSLLLKKSILARLLANENVSVEQTNHHTAFFDVKNRVLGLPFWKNIQNDLYDLLVGHEIGHALFTPADGWHDATVTIPGCPRSYVNVVEDIRIEKKVLSKYPGLLASFMRGYQDLLDRDFFGLSQKDVNKLSFMNRLNVFSKSRGLVKVYFNEKEQPYLDMAMAVETWEDVIEACRKIYEFVKDEIDNEENQQDSEDTQKSTLPSKVIITADEASEGDGSNEELSKELMKAIMDGKVEVEIDEESFQKAKESKDAKGLPSEEESDNEDAKGSSSEEESDKKAEADPIVSTGAGSSADDVETDKVFRQNFLNKLVDSVNIGGNTIYAKGPNAAQALATISSYEEVKHARYSNLAQTDERYKKAQTETKQTVMIMVKEFEMRKAAFRTARARVSTKGSLDVNQLHKYKYDDQLFKQVTYLADSQSHGMVMLVDYSGSMDRVLKSVLKQLVVMTSFCKRVNIPFEVYGFTSANSSAYNTKRDAIKRVESQLTAVKMTETHIFKLIASDMPKPVYEEAYRALWAQSEYGSGYRGSLEQLNGTPLNSALLSMMHVIQIFKSKHKVQKMNFITLTDGESESLDVSYGIDAQGRGRNCFIDHMGFSIEQSFGYGNAQTNTKNILECFTKMGVRTLNYYINPDRYNFLDAESAKKLKEEGIAVVDKDSGYDRRFFIRSNSEKLTGTVEDMKFDNDANSSKIAREFSKYATSKKNARTLASKFAEVIS